MLQLQAKLEIKSASNGHACAAPCPDPTQNTAFYMTVPAAGNNTRAMSTKGSMNKAWESSSRREVEFCTKCRMWISTSRRLDMRPRTSVTRCLEAGLQTSLMHTASEGFCNSARPFVAQNDIAPSAWTLFYADQLCHRRGVANSPGGASTSRHPCHETMRCRAASSAPSRHCPLQDSTTLSTLRFPCLSLGLSLASFTEWHIVPLVALYLVASPTCVSHRLAATGWPPGHYIPKCRSWKKPTALRSPSSSSFAKCRCWMPKSHTGTALEQLTTSSANDNEKEPQEM